MSAFRELSQETINGGDFNQGTFNFIRMNPFPQGLS